MHAETEKKLAILGIALPLMAVGMNFSIVNMAMATLQTHFSASISELQWLLNITGIFVSVWMVTMGKLADVYGRRRIYLIGSLLVCTASLIAGLAPKLGWIIAAQALEGIAAAIVIPISQALLSHLYPEEKRAQAIGIWATLACTSLGLGPVVGGILIEIIGWRSIFLINVPCALLALYPIFRCVRESKNPQANKKISFQGVFFLILTIASLVIAIMQAPEWGWNVLWLILFFIFFLLLFIRSERQTSSPIIRPDFFFRRTFLLATLTNCCIVFFVWGAFFLMPYYLQNERGYSPLQAGLLMLLVTGPVVLFSPRVSQLYLKTGPKPLMIGGLILFLLSSVMQLFFTPSTQILPFIAALCFGFGWVIAWGPSITTAVSSVPRDEAGLASGAFTTVQEIGGTLGLTIAGTAFRLEHSFADGAYVLLVSALLGLVFSFALSRNSGVINQRK
jgi:EmrB/QacA subfamily drug resistance transporter